MISEVAPKGGVDAGSGGVLQLPHHTLALAAARRLPRKLHLRTQEVPHPWSLHAAATAAGCGSEAQSSSPFERAGGADLTAVKSQESGM